MLEASVVKTERNDPKVWNAIWDSTNGLAALADIQPSHPRRILNQEHRPNAPADNPSHYWKRNMYVRFVDHLTTELETRLLQCVERFKAQHLLPNKVANLPDDTAREVYVAFQPDLTGDEMDFVRESRKWKVRWGNVVNPQFPLDCLAETQRPLSECQCAFVSKSNVLGPCRQPPLRDPSVQCCESKLT